MRHIPILNVTSFILLQHTWRSSDILNFLLQNSPFSLPLTPPYATLLIMVDTYLLYYMRLEARLSAPSYSLLGIYQINKKKEDYSNDIT